MCVEKCILLIGITNKNESSMQKKTYQKVPHVYGGFMCKQRFL